MVKVGRNSLCPCGSLKKYKRCHGAISDYLTLTPAMKESIEKGRDRAIAASHQRQAQQGMGREIISAQVNETRFVAINNQVLHSKHWVTFFDFLSDYIKIKVGSEWGNSELQKGIEERHEIFKWYARVCDLQAKYKGAAGEVVQMPRTGAVDAYYWLAYDLYCIDHNAELQQALFSRLKNPDQNFYGVLYEISVAARMIRAGFTLSFEDEADRRTSHCEFTAISGETGKKFSVECKRLESTGKVNHINLSKLGKRFAGALVKQAEHERIVFIDLNFGYDSSTIDNFRPVVEMARKHIRKLTVNQKNGGHLPPAMFVLTNHPTHLHLDDVDVPNMFCMDGFKIPEFDLDRGYTLDERLANREIMKDMEGFILSMRKHSRIPTTFDGRAPQFAFNPALERNRLLIGEKYRVSDPEGGSVLGILEQAFVMDDHTVTGLLKLENGKMGITRFELSKEEFEAYKMYPDTFFGAVTRNHTQTEADPVEIYDRMYEAYRNTTKEKLLEFMAEGYDVESLKNLSRDELASMYTKGFVNHILSLSQKKIEPT